MNHFNPQSGIAAEVLATDLDGTLIPLPETPENEHDLVILKSRLEASGSTLVFATGRHFESVISAIEEYALPIPDWIVCDVGSSIYQRRGDYFERFKTYETHLLQISKGVDRSTIEQALKAVKGIELQAPEHQQCFKISYQSAADVTDQLVDQINNRLQAKGLPYACMGSLDPFSNWGLLDVLPSGLSKAYALLWLSTHAGFTPDTIIYSGDSGNDYAALASGFRAIIVGNASDGLRQKVEATLIERGIGERLYIASGKATSGVLEGCRQFGLF